MDSKYLLAILVCITICLPNMNGSSFQIIGDGTITCLPAETVYEITGFQSQNTSEDDGAQSWVWEVTGGRFLGGGTKLTRPFSDHGQVSVEWKPTNLRQGRITVQLIDSGGKPTFSASRTIYFQLPEPKHIMMEDGPMDCEGNWFFVETSIPLSDDEIVEWNVSNGLDADGGQVSTILKKGAESHRIFLKQMDMHLPLVVSAKLRSDCGNASRRSKAVDKSFRRISPKIIGPSIAEAMSTVSFTVCPISNNNIQDQAWSSTGHIVGQGEGGVTVYFPDRGTGTVEISLTDCNGTKSTIKKTLVVGRPIGRADEHAVRGAGKLNFYRIFPNPSLNGQLNIELEEDLGEGQVELLSLQGQRLITMSITDQLSALDTSGVPSGFYIIRIKTPGKEATEMVGINLH